MKRTDIVLWAIFISLLLVLLPHTAWFFSIFENPEPYNIFGVMVKVGYGVAFFAAFAFEAAIAALVHKLSEHIREAKPGSGSQPLWLRRLTKRYMNVYSLGLLLVVSVSAIANYAHALEFGGEIEAFARMGIPLEVYSVVAGGILPVCSLLFASVLSNVKDTEQELDPELVKAKDDNKTLRIQNKQLNERIADGERKAIETYQEFTVKLTQAEQMAFEREQQVKIELTQAEQKAAKYSGLLSEAKKDRVLTARELWPALPYSSLEIVTGASGAYISDVIKAASQPVNGTGRSEKGE